LLFLHLILQLSHLSFHVLLLALQLFDCLTWCLPGAQTKNDERDDCNVGYRAKPDGPPLRGQMFPAGQAVWARAASRVPSMLPPEEGSTATTSQRRSVRRRHDRAGP
jgi:hypothetical protein